MRFLIKIAAVAVAVWITTMIVPGIQVTGGLKNYLVIALVLASFVITLYTIYKQKKLGDMMEFILPLSETNFEFPMVVKRPESPKPTVDQILDKISEKGIESLTKEEKQILDNYATRKNGGNQIN